MIHRDFFKTPLMGRHVGAAAAARVEELAKAPGLTRYISGFANNRIHPALFSPAAVKIARMLPTSTDPCGQIAYSRTTKPRESQPYQRLMFPVQRRSVGGIITSANYTVSRCEGLINQF